MSRAHKQFPSDFYMNLMMAFSCRLSPLKDHPNCQVQAARHDRHRVFGALESADYQNASAVRNHQRQQPCKLVPGRYKTSEMFFCVTAFSRFTQLFFFFGTSLFTCQWHFDVSQRSPRGVAVSLRPPTLFCSSEKNFARTIARVTRPQVVPQLATIN